MDPAIIAIEAAGWLGAVLVLAGYALASIGRLDARSPTFQWLNLVGAAGFVINTAWHGAWPSMALNVVWCAIAAATLLRRGRQGSGSG
jgi:hypothetical protein